MTERYEVVKDGKVVKILYVPDGTSVHDLHAKVEREIGVVDEIRLMGEPENQPRRFFVRNGEVVPGPEPIRAQEGDEPAGPRWVVRNGEVFRK
jgi:hypothetical protein